MQYYWPLPRGSRAGFSIHMKDISYWPRLFAIILIWQSRIKTYWIMIVMDQFSRKIVGFSIHRGDLTVQAVCYMFMRGKRRQSNWVQIATRYLPRRLKQLPMIYGLSRVKLRLFAFTYHLSTNFIFDWKYASTCFYRRPWAIRTIDHRIKRAWFIYKPLFSLTAYRAPVAKIAVFCTTMHN